jgi:hypothetical protein
MRIRPRHLFPVRGRGGVGAVFEVRRGTSLENAPFWFHLTKEEACWSQTSAKRRFKLIPIRQEQVELMSPPGSEDRAFFPCFPQEPLHSARGIIGTTVQPCEWLLFASPSHRWLQTYTVCRLQPSPVRRWTVRSELPPLPGEGVEKSTRLPCLHVHVQAHGALSWVSFKGIESIQEKWR